MDVVYLVRPGNDNNELRYSLRSLKNVPHDRVHVVGYKPTWVKGVVEHSYSPGVPPLVEKHGKHWKSWRMMRYLCTLDDISDEFVLFNDDFYVMREVDSVPILHRGQLQKTIDNYKVSRPHKANPYVVAMLETQELLRTLGRPTLCYEVHAPMVIDRHKMTTAMEVVEAMARPGLMHINKRSFYGNYWEIGGTQTEDVKVDSARPEIDPDSTFLSSSDHSFQNRSVGQFVKRAFPHPSPYEVSRRANPYHSRTSRTGPGSRPEPGRNRSR